MLMSPLPPTRNSGALTSRSSLCATPFLIAKLALSSLKSVFCVCVGAPPSPPSSRRSGLRLAQRLGQVEALDRRRPSARRARCRRAPSSSPRRSARPRSRRARCCPCPPACPSAPRPCSSGPIEMPVSFSFSAMRLPSACSDERARHLALVEVGRMRRDVGAAVRRLDSARTSASFRPRTCSAPTCSLPLALRPFSADRSTGVSPCAPGLGAALGSGLAGSCGMYAVDIQLVDVDVERVRRGGELHQAELRLDGGLVELRVQVARDALLRQVGAQGAGDGQREILLSRAAAAHLQVQVGKVVALRRHVELVVARRGRPSRRGPGCGPSPARELELAARLVGDPAGGELEAGDGEFLAGRRGRGSSPPSARPSPSRCRRPPAPPPPFFFGSRRRLLRLALEQVVEVEACPSLSFTMLALSPDTRTPSTTAAPRRQRHQRHRHLRRLDGQELLVAAALFGEGHPGDLGAQARPERQLEVAGQLEGAAGLLLHQPLDLGPCSGSGRRSAAKTAAPAIARRAGRLARAAHISDGLFMKSIQYLCVAFRIAVSKKLESRASHPQFDKMQEETVQPQAAAKSRWKTCWPRPRPSSSSSATP